MRVKPCNVRGQTLTEFALVVPVLIVIVLYSLYFTELVRAKLKLQEASRFVAWEMTSRPLDDYGRANHSQAFALASQAAQQQAAATYQDLESIDTRPAGDFVVGYSGFKTAITALKGPAISQRVPAVTGNPFVGQLLGVLNGSASAAFAHFGFNTQGKVQVEVSIQLDNRLLPQHFLDQRGGFFLADVWGGRSLQKLRIKDRFTLLASGWNLPDGADAEQHRAGRGGPRSGVHRGGSVHGLHTQVSRMRLLGAPQLLAPVPGLDRLMKVIGNFVPNPLTATAVVSHNYFASGDPGIKARGCDGVHGAPWGQNNLKSGPGLDDQRRKCFDTAPFRDTSRYDDSQYRAIFEARGAFFMGCKKAQADNPAEAGTPSHSSRDRHTRKVECEGR